MKSFKNIFLIAATIIALGTHSAALPTEASVTAKPEKITSRESKQAEKSKAPVSLSVIPKPDKDLDTSHSNQQTTYVLPEHHGTGNSAPGAFDPSIYSGYLTPEAFQQYLAQFTNAFGPYGYPGYGPPVYPGPYAVQTGYDGFLVPAAASTSLSASGTVASTNGIITALSNLLPTLMDSIIFRVIITVVGVVLMLVFGGAVTTAICNFTPICDISFKAVSYLRGRDAGDKGRMLAEEMTPERIKRAADIVHTAIRKYKEMQKRMGEEKDTNA